MQTIKLRDADGELLDVKIDIGAGDIVVHRRSGAGARSRNPDYRKALELLADRLLAEYITPDTYLDSAPARTATSSAEARRLISAEEFFINGDEFASEAIRRSDAGSRSHGAWRRLLLRIPSLPDYALRSIVEGEVLGRRPRGIPRVQLRLVELRHVTAAIAELRSGHARHTRFENPMGWELYPGDGGDPLPPKKVFGIALAEVLKTHTTPDDFTSGDFIFERLREFGFEVRRFDDAPVRSGRKSARPTTKLPVLEPTDEERGWLEGNPRLAEHLVRERHGGVAATFKAEFRVTHGRLFCQRCTQDYVGLYEDEAIAEACFEVHHTTPIAKMQPGHVTTREQLRLLCANCHRATHRELAREASAARKG